METQTEVQVQTEKRKNPLLEGEISDGTILTVFFLAIVILGLVWPTGVGLLFILVWPRAFLTFMMIIFWPIAGLLAAVRRF